MNKATIYDYSRMCKFYNDCGICPLGAQNCMWLISNCPNKANEIILKWCEEHPVETRQDRFLKIFPNAIIGYNGCLEIIPCDIDTNLFSSEACATRDCEKCCEEYWLAEVDEK